MLGFIKTVGIVSGSLVILLLVFIVIYYYFTEIVPEKRFRRKMNCIKKLEQKLAERIVR